MADHSFRSGRPSGFFRGLLGALLVGALLSACSDDQPDGVPPPAPESETYVAPAGVLLAPPSVPEEDNSSFEVFLDLVEHTPPGEPGSSFVLTGSDNYTTASLTRPELLLRLNGPRRGRFARYERWVDRLVARGE
ncbi:hypothetical protein [Nocardioides sp.]|uniref:hypothetical protein n=1 Tax=Nocardioides sp. TaxID=35761 RepID=UPI002B2755D3|nr:hypothetical protein [Nocardioides sp.]